MPIYTTRLLVIPQYNNIRPRLDSTYSYQRERFCSTLIVYPHGMRKRFIQGIEVRCGSFSDESTLPSRSPSDVLSFDELMINDEEKRRVRPIVAESYYDRRRRLMGKSLSYLSNHFRDDTDADENDSFDGFSSYLENPLQISAHL